MRPIIEKISFYPFSFNPIPKQEKFDIERYNIFKHKWIVIERRAGTQSEIEEYVHDLNLEAGIITEEFIVGYQE